MQRIANENIKAKIKQSIDQEDFYGNKTILNMINYNQFNAKNIGTIILLETLRIDTSSKIKSSLIELHFIDEKEIQ